MKKSEIEEIIECFSADRIKFYYFKDRYALMLLADIVGSGMPIRELKESRFGRLVYRPIVKKITKATGGGQLTAGALGAVWPGTYHCYRLTMGMWGHVFRGARFYNQTSRPGQNLVLQLNFSSRHNHTYHRLLKPSDPPPFQCFGHPVVKNGQNTLAWARIDMDLETDEALIEEIQTDWIRRAVWSQKYLAAYKNRPHQNQPCLPGYVKRLGCDFKALSQYMEETLKPHMRLWDEAMLASAIWFLKKEIGIKKIYYHTHKFGCQMKRIMGSKPPRSLYTGLPDRFCFRKIGHAPTFLWRKNNRKIVDLIKHHNPRFYLLDLQT